MNITVAIKFPFRIQFDKRLGNSQGVDLPKKTEWLLHINWRSICYLIKEYFTFQ